MFTVLFQLFWLALKFFIIEIGQGGLQSMVLLIISVKRKAGFCLSKFNILEHVYLGGRGEYVCVG